MMSNDQLSYNTISEVWCSLNQNSKIIILTEAARLKTAERIKQDNMPYVSGINITNIDQEPYEDRIKALSENDLVIVLFTVDGFMNKNYRAVFSPFSKPLAIKAKYVFIRLDIPEPSLLSGLATGYDKMNGIIQDLEPLSGKRAVHVTAPGGTDITLRVGSQEVLPISAHEPGGFAFLPPSEVSEVVEEGSANGIIVADITVGELHFDSELIDPLGLVDRPVKIRIEHGLVTEITGGKIAERLKKGLTLLDPSLHQLIELGHGLSDIKPTGIIGVDESMNCTCHFGIGNRNPYHLDVVVSNPNISLMD